MSKTKYCFYCYKPLVEILVDDKTHQNTDNARSDDHFYPKKHPKYSGHKKVKSCLQCNFTKSAGDPIKFIEALQKKPLPVWGVKSATKNWYLQTGYDSNEFN